MTAYMENPKEATKTNNNKHLLNLIIELSKAKGYKIYTQKPVVFPVTGSEHAETKI